MKSEKRIDPIDSEKKIFVLPLILLALLLLGLGGLYYYAARNVSASAEQTSTTTTSAQSSNYSSNSANPVPYLSSDSSGNSSQSDVVQVSNQGVLANRLAWQTFTDADYSFAISYPHDWRLLGSSSLVSATDGSASVSVHSFNLTPNTTPSLFASENGVSGFETTSVNAYDAVEAFQGSNTLYFIVNGSVGYEITVPTSANENDANVIRAMLATFTTTKAR